MIRIITIIAVAAILYMAGIQTAHKFAPEQENYLSQYLTEKSHNEDLQDMLDTAHVYIDEMEVIQATLQRSLDGGQRTRYLPPNEETCAIYKEVPSCDFAAVIEQDFVRKDECRRQLKDLELHYQYQAPIPEPVRYKKTQLRR